ncbi:ComEA family DNA-binding protein [Marinimicrobium alkaliphilum]|uniref:ComEA family DNA-binding protein n=1 Tax=Marinimicrobium alkaliphilum TaxID=2202654 RepID=UPI001E5CC5D4|nr:ComEA family DNA-binding protein [Marinimicrobium alkaliphilum]
MTMIKTFLLTLTAVFALSAFAVESEPVNLNTADVEALTSLQGIGQKKAEDIIAWRDANGGFSDVEELTEVQGIGEATLSANRERLTLE